MKARVFQTPKLCGHEYLSSVMETLSGLLSAKCDMCERILAKVDPCAYSSSEAMAAAIGQLIADAQRQDAPRKARLRRRRVARVD